MIKKIVAIQRVTLSPPKTKIKKKMRLVKPARAGELRARLKALVRRAGLGDIHGTIFEYDRFRFDLQRQTAQDSGRIVELTQKEFQLALLFLNNIGKPLSRGHIREAVWGRDSEVPSRTMDTHVSRVRSKLTLLLRSEERRVGKECRSRWSTYH